MRKRTCAICEQDFPHGDLIDLHGASYCEQCFENNERLMSQIEDASRSPDPTMCARCGHDNGLTSLPQIMELPLCGDCTRHVTHYPYPTWVKVFFGIIAAVVIAGLAFNYKYFGVIFYMRAAAYHINKGDGLAAEKDYTKAATLMPEIDPLRSMRDYLRAGNLMNADRSAEALIILKELKKNSLEGMDLDSMIVRAECGASFERGDYASFYRIEKEQLALAPDDPACKLRVASAAACLFAINGNRTYRNEAISLIAAAQSQRTSENEEFMKEYIPRINYRIHSREIISGKEYYRRFPDGWKGEPQ
jgi:hypothetical protein